MSVYGHIIADIIDLIQLKRALSDLELKLKNTSQITTQDGRIHNLDVVVTDPYGKQIGFEKTDSGNYRVIADSKGLDKIQLKKQKEFINKIRQRYAYNKITDELKKQGFIIVEEEKIQNNTIRLVARKWS